MNPAKLTHVPRQENNAQILICLHFFYHISPEPSRPLCDIRSLFISDPRRRKSRTKRQLAEQWTGRINDGWDARFEIDSAFEKWREFSKSRGAIVDAYENGMLERSPAFCGWIKKFLSIWVYFGFLRVGIFWVVFISVGFLNGFGVALWRWSFDLLVSVMWCESVFFLDVYVFRFY